MSVFSRFFGKSGIDDPEIGGLVANPKIKHSLSLQILFPTPFLLDSRRLADAFRAYHPSMSKVFCEIDPTLGSEGAVLGMVGWEKHVVRYVGFGVPMPAQAVEACIAPSHYSRELMQHARSHKAHIILYYAGYVLSPVEQYVALAATAGVLARFGAIVVLDPERMSF